jgi:hypothetical protein
MNEKLDLAQETGASGLVIRSGNDDNVHKVSVILGRQ